VGGILIITSRSARNASFDALYATVKGGLQSFALSLALRLDEKQSIVCVAPSLIKDSTMYSTMSGETHSRHLARAHGSLLEISQVAEFIWSANPEFCQSLNGRTIEIGYEI
jgi:NAD(P)-dependent dehydrogenase (short-subunit alcohol dehydrogenase family)